MTGLVLKDLRIALDTAAGPVYPVEDVSLEVAPRQCLALLGESGCGKSLTALALMRLLPEGMTIVGGSARLGRTDLFALPERAMRAVRGGQLAMVFQEPMQSLNPVLTVGQQIEEALAAHRPLGKSGRRREAEALMAAVGLSPERLAAYPFQLSGGQRQRALIAMMLAGEPKFLIADEPTTALDVTVQAQILKLLKDLQQARGMGLLLITHDLDVARDMADEVAVMYAGQIVERASRERLYAEPRHPYTRRLFSVLPSVARRGEALAHIPGSVPPLGSVFRGCRFAERCPAAFARCHEVPPELREFGPGHWLRCHLTEPEPVMVARPEPGPQARHEPRPGQALLEVCELAVHFPIRRGLLQRQVGQVKAVDGVSFSLAPGETLALVGESGCGKTTLARAILRLIEPTAGRVYLEGVDLASLAGEALRRRRADMQIVFQDPFASLNPRMRIGEVLEEGVRALQPELSARGRAERIARLLAEVGLEPAALRRYPHEFSGGQRQRIAIARALAVGPKLLICDEPTSALDVSVQAQILNLLKELQARQGLAYLFISHNLAVVGYLARRVAVMYRGRIVELGQAAELFARPLHPYTQLLLESAPGHGLVPSRPATGGMEAGGCAFAPRCPEAQARCRERRPDLIAHAGRQVACWLYA